VIKFNCIRLARIDCEEGSRILRRRLYGDAPSSRAVPAALHEIAGLCALPHGLEVTCEIVLRLIDFSGDGNGHWNNRIRRAACPVSDGQDLIHRRPDAPSV
jgi:hypothetical protein